jgi:hypothetical protein
MVRVVGLGLIQNEHGVWCVRRKVPKRLEEAVARVQGAPRARQPWLKRSLRTKDEKRAKVLAKPVMIEFDRILAQAEAMLVEQPVRTSVTEAEIKAISDYFYAHELSTDQELREEGIGSDQVGKRACAQIDRSLLRLWNRAFRPCPQNNSSTMQNSDRPGRPSQASQFSTFKPRMRLNSSVLAVTTVAPIA